VDWRRVSTLGRERYSGSASLIKHLELELSMSAATREARQSTASAVANIAA
jgi:hypothetical protein